MKFLTFFMGFVVGQVLSLHVEEGCEAKTEWKVNYKWNEIQISFWAPTETSSKLLSVDVEFVDQIHPVTYDNIEVYHNKINLIRIREGEKTQEIFTIFNITGETWTDFVFSLDTDYNFQNLQNDTLLPRNVSVDYTPKILTISGSNVTVNCPTDQQRIWKISEEHVALPLQDSEHHNLSFYSFGKYLPVISLEMRQFNLGWNNGRLTTIPTMIEPLPAFVQHRMIIDCRQDAEIICTVKIGEYRNVAETLRFAEFPKSITISKKQGASFNVFKIKADLFTSQQSKNLQQTKELSSCETTKAITLGLGIACSLIVIIIILVAAFIINKERNLIRNETNSAENNGRNSDIESAHRQDTRTSGDTTSEGSGDPLIK